jgi:hypothetical protein
MASLAMNPENTPLPLISKRFAVAKVIMAIDEGLRCPDFQFKAKGLDFCTHCRLTAFGKRVYF